MNSNSTRVCARLVRGFVTAIAVAASPSALAQQVIYVNALANSNGTGASWGTAYKDLQPALAAAAAVAGPSHPVEVWVAQGTYWTSPQSSPQRSAAFELHDNVAILGGFSGSESQKSQRHPLAFQTILSGDILRNDTARQDNNYLNSTEPSRIDNSYHVVHGTDVHASAKLDGFQITGGYANGAPSTSDSTGGGLLLDGTSNPTISRCVFINNYASGEGGAIESHNRDSLVIASCRFLHNTAGRGGALLLGRSNGPGEIGLGLPRIMNCTFNFNHSGYGGAFLMLSVDAKLYNCTVSGDSSGAYGDAGSVGVDLGASVRVYNTIFSNNSTPPTYYDSSVFETYNCVVPSQASAWHGTRNIVQTNVQFVDVLGVDLIPGSLDDDLHLEPCSGLADAGDNTYLNASLGGIGDPADLNGDGSTLDRLPLDADDQPRVVRTPGVPQTGTGDSVSPADFVSIGAFENPGVVAPIYVRANAPAGGNGRSWSTAYNDLQLALAASITPYSCPREIWVAAGTYKPAGPGGSRASTFGLSSGLAIYGGFAGNETHLSQRSIAAHPTILSGDLNGDDDGNLNRSDNCYHVLTMNGLAYPPGEIIDGFTITGGEATGSGNDSTGGGILQINSSGGSTYNCTFIHNRASGNGGAALVSNSQNDFENCVFTDNTSLNSSGGAIAGQAATVWLYKSVLEANSAVGAGGAVFAGQDSLLIAKLTDFIGNSSTGPGGEGGAIYVGQGVNVRSIANLTNCRLQGNSAVTGSATSATQRAILMLTDCLVTLNRATDAAAMYFGPGAWSTAGRIYNCTIAGNNGVRWAGVLVEGNSSQADIFVYNSLVWGNSSGGSFAQAQQVDLYGSPSFHVYNSSVQNWSGSLAPGDPGNNALNPLFNRLPSFGADGTWGTADDDYGDLRLSPGSPAIDSAANADVPLDNLDVDGDGNTTEQLPLDLQGSPRFIDDPLTLPNGPSVVDRGCYEYVTYCPACPDDRVWIRSDGGDWTNDSNWLFGAPTSQRAAHLDLPGAYTVSFSNTAAAQRLEILKGSPTLDLSGRKLALGVGSDGLSLLIQGDALSQPHVTITNASGVSGSTGAVEASVAGAVARIADDPGTFGTIDVVGAGAKLSIPLGTLSVGYSGIGSLNVLSGATCGAQFFAVGEAAADLNGDGTPDLHGSILVDGAGTTLKPKFGLNITAGMVTVQNGGLIDCGSTGTVFILPGSSLTGDGTVNGRIVNFGDFEPRPASSATMLSTTGGFTTFNVNGQYEQLANDPKTGAAAGVLSLRYGQTGGLPISDKLVVNGTATLAGSLVLTSTNTAYSPPVGSSFSVLAATSITGNFTVSQMPALPQGKFLLPSYAQAYGRSGPAVSILTQTLTGDITLNPTPSQGVPGLPKDAVLGDFDGFVDPTGHTTLDMAITVPDPVNPSTAPGSIVILRNAGVSGGNWQGFTLSTTVIPVGKDPRGLVAANLNGDGRLDLAVCNFADNTVSVLTNNNTGNGAMTTAQTVSVGAGAGPVAVAAADFRASGKQDLVVANQTGGTVNVLNNSGSATFTVSNTLSADAAPTAIAVADFNGDNLPDLATANRDAGTVTVFLNRPSTHVLPVSPDNRLLAGETPIDIQPGNIDNSKARSLVCVNKGSGTLSFFVNDGAANFSAGAPLPVGSSPESLTMNDLDNDGDLDIGVVTADSGGQRVVRVLRNDDQTNGVTYTNFGDQYTSLDPRLVRSGDVDNNGRNDLVAVTNISAVLRASTVGPSMAQGAGPKPDRVAGVEVSLAGTHDFSNFDRSANPGATVQLSAAPYLPPPCPEDINGDRAINTLDLGVVLSHFGQSVPPGTLGDIASTNGYVPDGVVNTIDLGRILTKFGTACP